MTSICAITLIFVLIWCFVQFLLVNLLVLDSIVRGHARGSKEIEEGIGWEGFPYETSTIRG